MERVTAAADEDFTPSPGEQADHPGGEIAWRLENGAVARLLQGERRARREAELAAARIARLQGVTAALAEAVTPAQVAAITVEQGVAASGAAAGSLVLLEPDGLTLRVVQAAGYAEEQVRMFRSFPVSAPLPLADAVRTGEPVYLGDARVDVPARYPSLAAVVRYRAAVALPLRAGSQVVGAIGLSFADRQLFPEEERGLLLAVARQCAQALERARLFEAEREARSAAEAARNREAFLSEVSVSLAGSLDPEATLRKVAHLAVPMLSDWCFVHATPPGGVPHRVAIAHSEPAREAAAWEFLSQQPVDPQRLTPPVRVACTAQAELHPEVPDELLQEIAASAPHLEWLRGLGLCSAMIVPLTAGDRLLGAISFLSAESGRRYEASDLSVAQDLSRRAALAIENALLHSRVQQAARDREELLAVVSHDLRNPLGAVMMNAEVLLRTGAAEPERTSKRVEGILRAARRMRNLIHDLLDVARIDGGVLEVSPTLSDARALLLETAELFQQEAAEKRIRVAVEPDSGAGEVLADRDRVVQVLVNLVSNALRFTPAEGSVTLAAARSGAEIVLSVIDTGEGIPRDQLERVFERFVRGSANGAGGTGLGLYICRGIAQAHGGRIWAESDLGRGAAFFVALPAA